MGKFEEMKKVRDETFAITGDLAEYRKANAYFPVVGEGSHDSKIMLIGEAPGRNEAKTGRPFCGAAGKVLNTLLASADIPRDQVYITNIVKDRPPENRDPTQGEIDAYGPLLDRQIDIIQPKVIATLGRYSMDYVMRLFDLDSEIEPISVAHGKMYEAIASYGPIKILPLYHPAAAIYNRSLIDTLTKDFQALRGI